MASKVIKNPLLEDAVAKTKGPASSGGTTGLAGDIGFPLVFSMDIADAPSDLADELAE